MKTEPETLSLCVIALNEEAFLPSLLEDLRNQTYDHALTEIILVDSGSSDGTRALMEAFSASHDFRRVQIADNPGKTQPAGWNVALDAACCEVVARIDAHGRIPPDYSRLVMEDIRSGEDVVGGPCVRVAAKDRPWCRVLLEAENAMFGSGFSLSRRGRERRYVATVSKPAYRREVFRRVGRFNETLLRTEDNEIHYRIRQAGYRILLDPRIRTSLVSRCDLSSMLRQKHQNGYWVGRTFRVCPGCLSLYHFAPFFFLLALVSAFLLCIPGFCLPLIVLLILYGLFALGSMILSMIHDGFAPLQFLLPVLFFLLHVTYGWGTCQGLLSGKRFEGGRPWHS